MLIDWRCVDTCFWFIRSRWFFLVLSIGFCRVSLVFLAWWGFSFSSSFGCFLLYFVLLVFLVSLLDQLLGCRLFLMFLHSIFWFLFYDSVFCLYLSGYFWVVYCSALICFRLGSFYDYCACLLPGLSLVACGIPVLLSLARLRFLLLIRYGLRVAHPVIPLLVLSSCGLLLRGLHLGSAFERVSR